MPRGGCKIMIIKNNVQSILTAYADNKTVKNMQTENKTAGTAKLDEVVLSSQAQEFSQVLQKAQSMSDVRADRVNQVSMQIDAGTYAVNAAAIAEKMLNIRY